MTGIERLADSIKAELEQLLPRQRKTQRGKLSLLVATMLDARSANLMDLAAALPLEADRTDMRYQWIARFLANPLVDPDEVMAPFARQVLERQFDGGEPLALILDQSKISDLIRFSCWRSGSATGRCRWRGGSRRPTARSASRSRRRFSTRWRPGCRPWRPSSFWATGSTGRPI
jgi:hypothetical protein